MMITEKERVSVWSNKVREQLKTEYFVNRNDLANASSELALKETNDCVVRAFMCALNMSYDQTHNYIKTKMNRKDGNGTYVNAYAKNIIGATKNGLKISFIGTHPSRSFMKTSFGSDKVLVNKKYKKPTGYTLKSFMENNPVGRFVLIVQGHAVAVVNGVLHANTNENAIGLYRSVWRGFELK